MRLILFLAAFLIHAKVLADTQYQSGINQTGLLELYTSEGCSSCPPADRWLSELTERDQVWSDYIPIAFHVDYWDYIGWNDRFADPSYSQRQRDHAATLGMRTVYTPGFFYNGQEWRNWFSRKLTAFPPGNKPGVLTLNVDNRLANVTFNATDKNLRRPQVTVAILGFGISTQVKAGENRGKTLDHDFVVLGVAKKRLSQSSEGLKATLPVPTTKIKATRFGIVAWVSQGNTPAPIQAVGGWFGG